MSEHRDAWISFRKVTRSDLGGRATEGCGVNDPLDSPENGKGQQRSRPVTARTGGTGEGGGGFTERRALGVPARVTSLASQMVLTADALASRQHNGKF